MPHPVQDEPLWKECNPSKVEGIKTYSRPLLGTELLHELCCRKIDGLAEVCMGFTFNTSLSADNLIARTRDSLAMARYQMPIIASTIVPDPNDDGIRSWEYTTLQKGDVKKLSSWINESLTVRRNGIDIEGFISEMNQRRTPYVHADGHEQHIHFYLLIDDASEAAGVVRAALLLHGGHLIIDARPALRCLNALFDWIANPPALDEISWGTEWERLPVGPLAATGGPRDDFDTKGMELLQRAGAIMMDPVPSLAIEPARTKVAYPGKMTRFQKSFDAQTSADILQACKKAGYTMQHLIDAALILHVIEGAESNGMKDIDVLKAHVTLNPTTIAQENFFVPPTKAPSHFISGLIMLPIRVMYSSVPPLTAPKKERLFSLMSQIKPQYDDYLANENTPHIMPAMLALAPEYPPRSLPSTGSAISSTMSNLGNLNRFVECLRTSEKNGANLEIEEFAIGLRLNWLHMSFHAWTLNGCLHLMIQNSDARNDDDTKRYLDEYAENILLITGAK
ncbi:hypothetical protein SCHPADRAFT_940690 [Schizopora paradoxa]|uniref:Uncharacterized protein n=1 Tax=Schizopora paradoxa TaxID=27342 RepID=A0A0H2S8C4_9AGAM|nr:hypothetical protein SCHPADRAFT_940690 [Schizopora paradoxa]